MATEHFKQSDGRFTVRAYTETNRHGNPQHRIRYGYRGDTAHTETAVTAEAAVKVATLAWQAHLDGLLDAPVEVPETIGTLVDLFCARVDLAPATKETYSKILARFVAFVGKDRDLALIGKAAVSRWFASMTCKPVSQAAYLRTLSALFKWARSKRYMDFDPAKEQEIERFKTTIRPWMQHHEWQPFLDACGPGHRIRAEFTLHVGLRASELAEARWSWLHGTVGRPAISVPVSKSSRARAIPLDARTQVVIELARAHWKTDGDPNGLIFGVMDKHNLRRDTVKACNFANKKDGVAVTVTDFHGLRRSCGARWLELGIPLFHVSRMLGHADVSTTARHYAGLADSTLAAEIDKVDAAANAMPGSDNVLAFPSVRGRKVRAE